MTVPRWTVSLVSFFVLAGLAPVAAAPHPSTGGVASGGAPVGVSMADLPVGGLLGDALEAFGEGDAAGREPWPWTRWHRQRVTPRFAYRQEVNVQLPKRRAGRAVRSGRGNGRVDGRRGGRGWRSSVEVRTLYTYRIRQANRRRARVQIRIDAIEMYRGRRFLGVVDRIPARLRRIDATITRRGGVRFNQEVALIGGPGVGFELVATRPSHRGYWGGGWRARAAGMLDLYNGRVVPVRGSRLSRPRAFPGLVPVSLVPADADWLYRHDAVYRPFGAPRGDGPGVRENAPAPRDPSRGPSRGRGSERFTLPGAPDAPDASRQGRATNPNPDANPGSNPDSNPDATPGPIRESDPSTWRRDDVPTLERVNTERHAVDDTHVEVTRKASLQRIR